MEQNPQNYKVSPLSPKRKQSVWRYVFALSLLLLGLVGYCLWLQTYVGQTPYKVEQGASAWQHYDTYIKPNGRLLSAAPWEIHLDSGERLFREFAIANETDSQQKFGIEIKSIGFFLDHHSLRGPAVPNTNKTIVAKLIATGTVYDSTTDGATASCFVFTVGPKRIAEIPVLLQGNNQDYIDELTYAVLVKEGSDVACESKTDSTGELTFTGLLRSDTGTEYKVDTLPISFSRLE